MRHTSRSGAGGRLAFITGASVGIGRALAVRLARDGWRVVVSSRRQDALESIAEDHPELADQLFARAVDVTDLEAFRALFESVEARLGPVDSLILNAGDYDPMTLDEFDPSLFERLIRVNFLGAVNGLEVALGPMRARGEGQILLTASLSAYRGLPRAAPYGASKAAVLNMAEALRPELEASGVRLRVINPGFVQTRLTDKNRFTMPQLITADRAAGYIAREMDGRHFEIFFPKRFGWTLKLMRLLPYRLYFAAVRRMVSG